jgi:hypothetical protein
MIIVRAKPRPRPDGRWAGWTVVWTTETGEWWHDGCLSRKDAVGRAEQHHEALVNLGLAAILRVMETRTCDECSGAGVVLEEKARK